MFQNCKFEKMFSEIQKSEIQKKNFAVGIFGTVEQFLFYFHNNAK